MAKGAALAMASDDNWQAESDMRTLIEAERIRGDSKRHKAAMKCYQKELKAVQALNKKK